MNNLKKRSGFTLIEVLLAVGVIAMALLALVGLLGATFLQVESVVQTNHAIGVVTKVIAALDNPKLVGGDGIAGVEELNSFDAVYTFTKNAVEGQSIILYVFDKEIDAEQPARHSPIPVVYRVSGDNFTQQIYNQQNGTGSVFRVEITISPLLEEQQIFLDPVNYEPTSAVYTGGPLPELNVFALAYLPLELKIYPHDFTDASVLRERNIRPILTQNIVINR